MFIMVLFNCCIVPGCLQICKSTGKVLEKLLDHVGASLPALVTGECNEP